MAPDDDLRPAVVTLHLWGVPRRAVPAAVLRMGTDRLPLRAVPGARFGKLLGIGAGRTFGVRDADPQHWGLLVCWDDLASAEAFEDGPTARGWARLAEERLLVRMRPLASRGRWTGRTPFGGSPDPGRQGGSVRAGRNPAPVAALTRARIKWGMALRFWRSVPPVSADLHQVPGLRMAVGIGEAPIGLQGTFSLWDDARAMTEFAYRRAPHLEVVRRTDELRWYAEELFARFEVLDVQGTFRGGSPLR